MMRMPCDRNTDSKPSTRMMESTMMERRHARMQIWERGAVRRCTQEDSSSVSVRMRGAPQRRFAHRFGRPVSSASYSEV